MISSVRNVRFPLAATFLVLLAWSVYAYATVRVNGDIVAEAIQVQRWMSDPWWVWSYPGQKHGGVIEYPFIALAELVSPGNVYGFTLLRVLYIPLVGLLLGISLHWAFPRWNLWPFALAAAVGPAVLHGFRMISDIYPFGWLLSASGIVLAFAVWSQRITKLAPLVLGVSGLLIGLGIYEHASSAVFSLALLAGGLTLWPQRLRSLTALALGVILGLIPMVIALFGQPNLPVVYSPTNIGAPNLAAITGLSTQTDAWRQALLPNGWGLLNADETLFGIPWTWQIAVNAVLLICTALLVIPIHRIITRSTSPATQASVFIAAVWLVGIAVLVLLSSIVSPIWYYATGLGFLVWITVVALPNVSTRRWSVAAVAMLLVLMASVSLRSILIAQPAFVEGARFKLGQARFNEQVAEQVKAAGVDFLYGDYWEVLPIAYASAGELTPITYDSNRFPLPASEATSSIIVGLTSGYLSTPVTLPRWTTAAEAESLVTDNCVERQDLNQSMPDGVRAFECPSALLLL